MNPLRFFQRTRQDSNTRQAHMTWATGSFSQSLDRTRLFLRRQLWVWPIIAIVVLSILGFGVRRAIESTMKVNLASQLQTILEMEVSMLQAWHKVQTSNVESLATDQRVRETIYQLLGEVEKKPEQPVVNSVVAQDLARELRPSMSSHGYSNFFLADSQQKIVAASQAAVIGQTGIADFDEFISKSLDGQAVVSRPFSSHFMPTDTDGVHRMGQPTMFVSAPVRDAGFQPIAVLALQIQPEKTFTQILQMARVGKSGESYAFDRSGRMVTNSRFDEDLILMGLLPDQEGSRSILNILVRDPGGDITKGFRPSVRRANLPLTRMAESATKGHSEVDVVGYRDYRGVPVVGAWTWLPEMEIGIATEIDVAEAYLPLTILRRAFWALYGLLLLTSVGLFAFTLVVAKMRREAQKAAIAAEQLGQYTLEKRLGSGAMGVVYKGRHSMLRRETAIKMLDVDKVNDDSIKRFEREVQITCQLNHPNTIAIYDYGRTPEGVFYYAMEYLDGIDLDALVKRYGPQPEKRVVNVLRQMCQSLFEAHSLGLVHRDIKPANVMINRRGCEPDVVKVLDFGLVKAVDEGRNANVTADGVIAGTPLYMSPEAIQTPMSVDGRTDIYAVGAVGYFLLTGQPVFNAENIAQLCRKQVDEIPKSLSGRTDVKVSVEMENVILGCLEKSRSKRPQTARDLAQLLEKTPYAHEWSFEDADVWWARHERGHQHPSQDASADISLLMDRDASGGSTADSAVDGTVFYNTDEE